MPRRIESSASSMPSTGLLSASTCRRCPARPARRAYDALDRRVRVDAAQRHRRRGVHGEKRPGNVRYFALRVDARARINAAFDAERSPARDAASRGSRTSRGAISSRTISRLCASTRRVASRMSPRGAGIVSRDASADARRARATHCRARAARCAAFTRMASAKTREQRVREADAARANHVARRARRFVARSGGVQDHLLVGLGNVHVETLLGDRLQAGAARRVANLSLQPHALGHQRVARSLEIANLALPVHAVHSPCNDACRHEDETNEHERDERRVAPRLTRRFAMREAARCERADCASTSSSDAVSARRVSVVPSATSATGAHRLLRRTDACGAPLRNACFTMRSSPE